MRFKQLDLNLLVALNQMLALRSISHAAEQMNMSQSAMSNALTRLRQYFDDPLLVQVGRRMELTARAEAMQEPVRDILLRVEATIDNNPDFIPEQSTREFSILVSDYTLTVLIPHVLAIVHEQKAGVKFRFLPQTDQPFVLLERGDADFLIAPAPFCSYNHPTQHLYEDPFVCVVWEDGKFGGKKLTAEAYENASHAVMVPPNGVLSLESQALTAHDVTRNIDLITFGFAQLAKLIVGTDKIATMHQKMVATEKTSLAIEEHPVPFAFPPLRQTLQWHKYRENDPGLRWLRGVFAEAAERLVH